MVNSMSLYIKTYATNDTKVLWYIQTTLKIYERQVIRE